MEDHPFRLHQVNFQQYVYDYMRVKVDCQPPTLPRDLTPFAQKTLKIPLDKGVSPCYNLQAISETPLNIAE